MSTEQTNKPSEAVKLNYIDKVYNTLSAFWRLRGRLALAVGVLSLILLAIATGVVSPGANRFSLGLAGLRLTLPLASFLAVGAGVLAALVVSWYAVLFRVNCLYLEIIRLYTKDLKYVDKAVLDRLKNPFHSATFYGALRAPYLSKQWRNEQVSLVKAYDWLAAQGVAYLFVAGLPIATEGIILWRLATTVAWGQNWIAAYLAVALSAIFFIVTIIAIISYYLKKPSGV
jgi:hypothetical protein